MKKFLGLFLFIVTIGAAISVEKNQYKEELLERGWLYGCTPANWSLTEPMRGGFSVAAMKGELEIMDLEVKAGLDISSCGPYLPPVVMQKKQPEALDFLLKNGYSANVEYLGYTYLRLGIYYKNPEMVEVLIKNGADVNQVSKKYTPLNFAIKKKNPEIVKLLIDAGANPDEKTAQLLKKTKSDEIKSLFDSRN